MSALYMANSIGYDTTFELNSFSEPRIRSEIEVVKNAVLFICFTKPGQYPSIPWLGLDIQRKLYSFYDEIRENDLVNDISNQCKALIPYFNSVIMVRKTMYRNKPSLMIYIEGRETYPSSYMNDSTYDSNRYLIGLTFDEMDNLVYNVNRDWSV